MNKKTRPIHMLPTRDPVQIKKIKGWKKIFHENGNEKKYGKAIFISKEIDSKSRD